MILGIHFTLLGVAPTDVLGAMITPAVLISACGTLVMSTSNRLSRVVERARSLSEAARLGGPADAGGNDGLRRRWGEFMTTTLRVLTPADAGAYQQLRLRGLREEPSAFASSYEEEMDRPFPVVTDRIASQADRCVLGAFANGTLIGVTGLLREPKVKLMHKAMIWGVYVAPESRRRGVARALMEGAIQRGREMPGLRQINLSVNAGNAPAIALYESCGFKSYGLERAFMFIDGVPHDELHMVCVIEAC